MAFAPSRRLKKKLDPVTDPQLINGMRAMLSANKVPCPDVLKWWWRCGSRGLGYVGFYVTPEQVARDDHAAEYARKELGMDL